MKGKMRKEMVSWKRMISGLAGWLDHQNGFWLYAVALMLSMLAAYESQVWRLGIFYDDWEGIFLYKQGFSALQIWNYFLSDRPFSALVHILYNPLVGTSTLGWHLLGLLLNWGAVLLLVRAVLDVWPRRVMEAGWIGLLLALYPGMHRQFVVHTSMPHYTSMLLFTLSLYLMIRAFHAPSRRGLLLGISVALALLQVLLIEYFAGLELIRLLILYYMFRSRAESWKDAARRAVRAWLPYALVFAVFLLYHFALLPAMQPAGQPVKNEIGFFGNLLSHPLAALVQYTQNILQDALYSILYVWTLPWVPAELSLQTRTILASWALGIVAAAVCALVMSRWQARSGQPQDQVAPGFLPLLCGSAFLLGGLPVWIADRQAVVGTWADRYLFGQIMGAVPLFVIGTVWLVGQGRKSVQNLVFAALLAGSISLQVRVGDQYASWWNRTRDYYWQLKWRAPSLQPGTFLVTTSTPVGGTDSYQNGLLMNTAFNAGYAKETLQYWWYNGPEELWVWSLGKYRPASIVMYKQRSLIFQSDMKHALPVVQDKSSSSRCIQVLDPIYEGEPLLSEADQQMFSIARPGMILLPEKPLPQDVFGPEPPHTWCYYYQRADLARQYAQWDQVLALWKQAGPLTSTVAYGPEYIPFIEAAANRGDWEQATDLTLKANATSPGMSTVLCRNWSRFLKEKALSEGRGAAWSQVKEVLACPELP
jgi:hypothetical protein